MIQYHNGIIIASKNEILENPNLEIEGKDIYDFGKAQFIFLPKKFKVKKTDFLRKGKYKQLSLWQD